MNLKVLFVLLIYYALISGFFLLGSSTLTGHTTNIDLNDSSLTSDELDSGGFFSTGVSFSRFVGFVTFGIGLSDDTPTWFKLIFGLWQTIVSIIAVGFIISSIWDG